MRESSLIVLSPLHLPCGEREAIERAIREAPRNDEGRLDIRYPELVIEAHLDGFFIHTSAAGWGASERPETISPELCAILEYAVEDGAAWLSFDREQPPTIGWPIFPEA